MLVSQAATILNTQIVPEFLGETGVTLAEDLSNFVDFGRAFTEMATNQDYERFHKKIADKVGKQIFVDRSYTGMNMDIIRDGNEWGSVVEKTRFIPDDFETNFVWELTNGQKYDDFLTFRAMDANVKYFNKKVTYRISIDKPYNQVKSAMTSSDAFMRYINAMEVTLQNKKTVGFTTLTRRIHNSMAAVRIANSQQIKLVTEYNAQFSTNITADAAFYDEDFIRFAISRIADISALMSDMSVLYNDGTVATFSPKNMQHLALNSLFSANIDTYLKANTYHPEFINAVTREEIPFWQGSGTTKNQTAASLADRTRLNITLGENILDEETTVNQPYVIGTLRDRDSIAIFDYDEYAFSFQNPDTGVTKTNYMSDLSLYADTSENFVVFTLE